MKKVFALVMILAMLAAAALADSSPMESIGNAFATAFTADEAPEEAARKALDLSAMSFDDLQALSSAVGLEIIGRPEFKEVRLPGGMFYVGTDIPAGRYEVRSTKKGILMYSFRVRKSEKDTYGTSYWIGTAYDTEVQVVTLHDGEILDVSDGAVIISPFRGLSWE